MKRGLTVLAVIAGAAGVFLIGSGYGFATKKAVSISMIGGADGPTSVFLAGKTGNTAGNDLMIAGCTLLAICIVSAIAAYVKHRKQH